MGRLTERDQHGNWRINGLPWEKLHTGEIVTQEMGEKIYGALAKLKVYEDLELTPEQIRELDELYRKKCEEVAKLDKELSRVSKMYMSALEREPNQIVCSEECRKEHQRRQKHQLAEKKKAEQAEQAEIKEPETVSGMRKTSEKMCRKCRYSGATSGGMVMCEYMAIEYHSRGCPVGLCDKFDLRKKRRKPA
jgi:hypothetical protein